MAGLTVDFRKHSGPTPADDMAAQISQTVETSHWTSSSMDSVPLHSSSNSGTLISKLNATFTFIWKEDFGPLSHRQVIFLLSPVRFFWRCFCFRSGLVALFLKMSERGDSWCTDSSFSSRLVKPPKCLKRLCLTYYQACGHPCCLCTFSYPISSFQSTLHLTCFDTALLEQLLEQPPFQ